MKLGAKRILVVLVVLTATVVAGALILPTFATRCYGTNWRPDLSKIDGPNTQTEAGKAHTSSAESKR